MYRPWWLLLDRLLWNVAASHSQPATLVEAFADGWRQNLLEEHIIKKIVIFVS
jgi:hypothetical protein